MNRDEMLARLVAGAQEQGAELVRLRAIVEEASELGATRALARAGLSDDNAPTDIGELRELLGAWRQAKKAAWKTVVDWVVRGALMLLLIGLAVRLGMAEVLR